MNPALESFIVSLGILVVGIFTIPLAGKVAGVKITHRQATVMGLVFFAGRWAWVWGVRLFSMQIG